MDRFAEVGLGFTEFVSQLLNETFDAVIGAQQHQLDQYLQIEQTLNLSSERFGERFLDETDICEKEVELFGQELTIHQPLTDAFFARVTDFIGSAQGIFKQNKLSRAGYETLKSAVVEVLVEERKEALQALLNQNEMARVVVDSGVIKTKMELTAFFEEDTSPSVPDLQIAATLSKAERDKLSKREKAFPWQSQKRTLDKVDLQEIADPETQEKVIVIDRSALAKGIKVGQIPFTRVIARPAKKNVNAEILSEVTIHFKTI